MPVSTPTQPMPAQPTNRGAVYFLCDDPSRDPVAHRVFAEADERWGLEDAGIRVDGREVRFHRDLHGNEFRFVRTADVLSHDYPRYLPVLHEHFADADFAGVVNWHEGANAPPRILCAHTTGDVPSGVFGAAHPQCTRNLLRALEHHRRAQGLDDWTVTTEATHWSGIPHGGTPEMLARYPVPLVDVEIGSAPEDWANPRAVAALASALVHVFDAEEPVLRSLLCVGGVHFEPAFSAAVLADSADHPLAVTHVLANQWIVGGRYEDETGLERMAEAARTIAGGVHAVAFHDNLKGAHKDRCRALAERLGVPAFKHQRLRAPAELGLW